jgi:hypothetical protein
VSNWTPIREQENLDFLASQGIQVGVIPEPSATALVLLSMTGGLCLRRRRRA